MIYLNRSHVNSMMEFCISNFGYSKYKNGEPPNIILRRKVPEEFKYDYGAYDYEKNTIYIFVKNAKSLLDVCDTFIHEYIHYKQNMTMYNHYFQKYSYNYDNHPYEKSAHKKAKEYKYKCRKYVLDKWKNS